MRTRRGSIRAILGVLAALIACGMPASAQALGPATAAGLGADEAAAARRVMMHALQGGNQGGCHPLPAGWSTVTATVHFPSSYGGYGEWVNNAELLPAGENLQAFLKSHSGGHFYQTAFGSGSTVHTTLCAPAGYRYWLIVDSGSAKVAVGSVTLLRPGATYHATLTAPPIGTTPSGSASMVDTGSAGMQTAQTAQVRKEQLLRSWFVKIPSLGMTAVEITPAFLNVVNARPAMRSVRGIFIVGLDANGWAASQGLAQYDVVTSVNGHPFTTIAQFEAYVRRSDALRFGIVRNKHRMVLSGSP